MKIIVTGGAGFIGSNLVKKLIKFKGYEVLNIDKLTYASNLLSLKSISSLNTYSLLEADICDEKIINDAINNFKPDAIFHLAAESHVDRSIESPVEFIRTNINGTYNLLNAAANYWKSLDDFKRKSFRFIHVSTDEVYGSLDYNQEPFLETSRYKPNSPYSASKASSDHLARAWYKTFKFPSIVTNCSNNYGPFQSLDKLIPLTINNALNALDIPIYGEGKQIRDWLYVDDHVDALILILEEGRIGESYCIGGNSEIPNLEVANIICDVIGNIKNTSLKGLIKFIQDRPGHDFRYAIDSSKLYKETGWRPKYNFDEGIKKTINWYIDNHKNYN